MHADIEIVVDSFRTSFIVERVSEPFDEPMVFEGKFGEHPARVVFKYVKIPSLSVSIPGLNIKETLYCSGI